MGFKLPEGIENVPFDEDQIPNSVYEMSIEDLKDEITGSYSTDEQSFSYMTRDVMERMVIDIRIDEIGGVEGLNCYEEAPGWAYAWMNKQGLL